MQGIVIAGTHSGCGKTIVTLGILAALKRRGLDVQAFKAGPDFIDSGLHRLITGRHSRNLDLWMCGKDYVKNCFNSLSMNADISVVEGVMGLYDGDYSTAKLAALLNLPVVIVVDAYGMAESAGAVVKGFTEFGMQKADNSPISPLNLRGDWGVTGLQTHNSTLSFAGVIFNRVASENHYNRLKTGVKDVPVLGYLPREVDFEIPHRHLGLTVAEEEPISARKIERLADTVVKYIDVDEIVAKSGAGSRESGVKNCGLRIANNSPLPPLKLRGDWGVTELQTARLSSPKSLNSKLRIAVAYDKAFCFYYEDNLDLLKATGAEIVLFSPLLDAKIPDNASAVYIGGGYPELYAEKLSKNESMLKSISEWADSGKPVYAECGGLMYLSRGIYDFEGNFHRMAQVFPFETVMKKDRVNLGYREIRLLTDSILGMQGDVLRGHEFHYSEIDNRTKNTEYRAQTEDSFSHLNPRTPESSNPCLIYSVKDNSGRHIYDEGYKVKNTLASYVHIHFGSNHNIAETFIKSAKET